MADKFGQAAYIVGRYGGTIEKMNGVAIMAIFGVLGRNEDQAFRAVQAALELREGVDALSPKSKPGQAPGSTCTAALTAD